jgi:hypothetical protein
MATFLPFTYMSIPMKATINIDCTPDEARQFMGLPDVQPFQEEMMKIMRDKVLENLKMMEPEVAMRTWMPLMNQGMSQGMDFFKSMMSGAATSAMSGASSARKKNKE